MNQTVAIHKRKASEMLAYRVPQYNEPSRSIQKRNKRNGIRETGKKQTSVTGGVVKNVMTREDKKHCKKNSMPSEEGLGYRYNCCTGRNTRRREKKRTA